MTSKKVGRSHIEYMHRAIWEHYHGPISEGMEIDHINGNRLDNRIENLRICIHQQNLVNRCHTPHTSVFRGVCWSKANGKWRASITNNSKWLHLGYFISEIAAARVYNAKAKELFGEFANLNLEV